MRGSAVAALLADFALGEPPSSLHPTVWMGRWIARGRSRRTAESPTASFVDGAALLGGGILLSAGAAAIVDRCIQMASTGLQFAVRGLALKPALSLAPLIKAAHEVQRALEAGDIIEARRLLGWHLVSRDTNSLTEAEVAGAAVESVAENLSDSVVAPLLAFRVGGLTAAYIYRMVNTADAMLGYHTPELEWFGKAAARTDDVLNLVPSRLSAALICCAAPVGGGSSHGALETALRDAGRTASPNAGWPMAAMAGALGVHLTKRDHYSLNEPGRPVCADDIGRACRIAVAASALAAIATDLT
jgi:adenosylcobinamide-phosphate synthase